MHASLLIPGGLGGYVILKAGTLASLLIPSYPSFIIIIRDHPGGLFHRIQLFLCTICRIGMRIRVSFVPYV